MRDDNLIKLEDPNNKPGEEIQHKDNSKNGANLDQAVEVKLTQVETLAEEAEIAKGEISNGALSEKQIAGLKDQRLLDQIEDLTRVIQALKDKRIMRQFNYLEEAIKELYELILNDRITDSEDISRWAHNLLTEARQIILESRIEQLAKAERNIQQVRVRMAKAKNSQRDARRWSLLITIWAVAWVITLVWLIFQIEYFSQFLISEVNKMLFQSFVFGGLGGASFVLNNLANEVNDYEYSARKNFVLLFRPFTGIILGGITYLLLNLGLLALGQTPPAPAPSEPNPPFLLYLSSWLVGFNQVSFFEFLDGVSGRMFPLGRSQEKGRDKNMQ